MAENPSVWGRMFARFQGEVSAETLEAYRRASGPVFELLDRVEARRLAFAADGLTPWTVPPAARAELLCAWNAFVLQSLGNDILDADYAEYPATAGFVPPATAEQVMAFYAQVEPWLDRAHQAHANPAFRLNVEVPARLPPWTEAEPLRKSHLRGLIRAMGAVGEHAAAAVGSLPDTVPDPVRQRQLDWIRQLYASAQNKARYAAELHGTDPPPPVQQRVEPYARAAVELFYEVGQLVADPTLADADAEPGEVQSEGTEARNPPPGPGQPDFDPWCLTHPDARALLQHDPRALAVLRQLWERDPNPARTVAVQREIQAALQRGDLGPAERDGLPLGYWFCCPWGAVYEAHREVTISRTKLKPGQQFVFEVRAAEFGHIKRFTRRIHRGDFQPGYDLSYEGAEAP